MSLTLNDEEIKQAITQYVNKQGIDTTDKEVDVIIKSGRKGNGYTAAVTITDQPTKTVKLASDNTEEKAESNDSNDGNDNPDSIFG